jgi:glycosyltransferase involved in cell wall biosynthesis
VQLSIIVPTFNEVRRVPRCLEALRPACAAGMEVIVADDGSTDGTAGVVAERFPEVRLMRLEHRGSAAARAAALAEAGAPRIAFLDADCTPDPGWVDAARAGQGIVMGRIRPEPTFRARMTALLQFGEFLGAEPLDLENFALLNVAGPAAAFRSIALPLVRHGHDRLWSHALARSGHAIRYDPAQSVLHAPELTLRLLVNRQTSYARRFVAVRRVDHELPGGRLVRFGPVAAPIFAVGRLLRDVPRLFRARRAIGIGMSLPAYVAGAAVLRTLDAFVFARELAVRDRAPEAGSG